MKLLVMVAANTISNEISFTVLPKAAQVSAMKCFLALHVVFVLFLLVCGRVRQKLSHISLVHCANSCVELTRTN